MRSRIAAAVAIIVCIVGSTATAAVAAGMRGTGGAAHPLRLTVGTLGAIGSLDPRHGDSTIAREVWNLQYPTLTSLDPKTLAPTTGLASGWGPTSDGRGWRYTLHKGLTWSDGQPVTAADVVYSLDHARDDHWPYAATIVAGLKARAVNDRTIDVTATDGRQPPAGLLLHVVPEHVYAKSADVGADVAKLGVSDGTWHVVSSTRDSVELDAATASSPALRQIVFRTYPNADALINAIAHKHVDVVSGVPDADVGRLEALSHVTVDHASDGTKYVLRFAAFPVGYLHAASEAIDRDALTADAVHGVGTPAPVEAEPDAARRDLQPFEADGAPEPTIAIPDDATSRRVGALVRADLAAAGLKTRVSDATPPRLNLAIERVPADSSPENSIDLFEPDTLQAFRSDNVTGWLPDPEVRQLVVFGPTVAQYAQLAAAPSPPGEAASNSVYALGAVLVLALCAVLYWIASRFHRRYVSAEETDVSS